VKQPAAPSLRDRLSELVGPRHGSKLALALLILLNLAFTPNFAAFSNLWNILLQVSTTVLVGIGMTFVIATGGIDLSVGSIMAVSSVVSALALGHGAAAAIAAGMVSAVAIGFMNGILVTRYAIQPFIVTLAFLITGRGIAQVISHDGELIPFDDPTFAWFGRGSIGPVPIQVAAMIVVLAAATFIGARTSFARYVIAVGGNERAARLAGVPVLATTLTVYVMSGFLSGLAGIIETARLGTTDPANLGAAMELQAIAAVVVGGTGLSGGRVTVGGTAIGALIMAIISTTFNMHLVPFAWSLVVQALIILLAVYLQRPKVA
jgi:simple sugar transport system permease protein/ribose transport system permease protein